MKHRWILATVTVLIILSIIAVVKLPTKQGLDLAGGVRIVLRAKTEVLPKTQKWSSEDLNSIIRIIRSRVDASGVSEPLIQPKGIDQIVVELPDIKDEDTAIKELQSTARMEFRHLYNVHYADNKRFRSAAAKYTLNVEPDENTGEDSFIFTDAEGNEIKTEKIIAESRLILTGDDMKPTSRATKDPQGIGSAVAIEFKREGKKKFADFTRRNVNEILAMVMDNKILSAPNISEAILNGQAVITGRFKPAEAQRLAEYINAGALPVPLEVIQVQSVEATLGQNSVTKSIDAGIWGLLAIVVFMIVYYLLPGLIADLALVIYALFTFALFKAIPVTLTLPGIAAFILSVGMAVDANILIFERLKEELRSGKTLRAAIDAGFARAFTSILDSNVCTMITCLILGYYGTGPIRGFALVLGLGVAISMFTALVVTRSILHMIVNTRFGENPALFGIGRQWVTGKTGRQYDIVGRMWIWFILSALIIIPGLYFWLGADGLKKGIDFTGGSLMQVEFKQPVPSSTIEELLVSQGLTGSMIQKDRKDPRIAFIRTKQVTDEQFAVIKSQVKDELGGSVQSAERIGPAISKELTSNAIKAILLASLAIVLYLSARFAIGGLANGFRFGMCAIIATLHDVCVIIGVFAILGHFLNWEIDSLFVTALLTVIGFSTHDTIVIFDRIRENLRHRAKGDIFDALVNKSILQSFARSINTSLTVIITLVALLVFGAGNIRQFVIALLIGVITGTYSSIFNASQLLVLWQRFTEKRPISGKLAMEAAGSRSIKASDLKPIAAETGLSGEAEEVVQQSDASQSSSKAKAKKKKRRF